MNNRIIIESSNLSYRHGRAPILHDVSFTVDRGERLAIVGPNGAGKSTLIRVLLGLLQRTSGSLSLHGTDINSLSRADVATSMAYVPQLLQSEVAFTVREFVAMGRYAHAVDGEDAIIEHAIAKVSLNGFEDRTVSSLSGGERQRVCIAAALAQESSIIVFDEPLAHLDPRQRMEVQSVLYQLDPSITQVVVTHDLEWVEKRFNKVLAMDGGSVVYEGDVNDFYRKRIDRDIFGDLSLKTVEDII